MICPQCLVHNGSKVTVTLVTQWPDTHMPATPKPLGVMVFFRRTIKRLFWKVLRDPIVWQLPASACPATDWPKYKQSNAHFSLVLCLANWCSFSKDYCQHKILFQYLYFSLSRNVICNPTQSPFPFKSYSSVNISLAYANLQRPQVSLILCVSLPRDTDIT